MISSSYSRPARPTEGTPPPKRASDPNNTPPSPHASGSPPCSAERISLLQPPEIVCDEVSSTPSSPIATHNLNALSVSSNALHATLSPANSLLAVNNSVRLRESTLTVNYPDNEADFWDDGEVCLMYARHEKIPMKDFAAEIRASMDVENFLSEAVLLLDLYENSVEEILDRMLRMLLETDEPHVELEEAKRSCFATDQLHKLAKTIQGTHTTYGGACDIDQSWICILCTMPQMSKRHVAIARLRTPVNLGRTGQEAYFVILVTAPTREKGTKNALETGRTFATLLADMELRVKLQAARSHDEFKRIMWEHTKEMAEHQARPDRRESAVNANDLKTAEQNKLCWFGRGVRCDLQRRIPHYISDFRDGVVGHRSKYKTASTSIFLYFACLLPSIAFGMLNDNNTHGKIGVKKVIYSQIIGGLVFGVLGGQPMTILLTTAPLAIFMKVIYKLCDTWSLDFFSLYACAGLWNTFFLIIYSVTDASRLMKWSTRSTEEIFSLFVSIAFIVDSLKDVFLDFGINYHSPACDLVHRNISGGVRNISVVGNHSGDVKHAGPTECLRASSMLYLLLTLGTVWLALSLYNFTKTPYLNTSKREALADYALPASVLLMSFFGSWVFMDVPIAPFNYSSKPIFHLPGLSDLSLSSVFGSAALGFSLSLLFFMDQNITTSMINNPNFKLRKGPAYSWDLLVIAFLNGLLSFHGLPMIHGALPHSPLHVRAMADVEDYVEQGHVYHKIVRVRETRLTSILSHILIGLSVLMLPYPLAYIPRPVLDGLFLYLAINSLSHNQLFERILLLVTEQAAYPPNHYIRSVPQRKVHMFTVCQLLQLALLCACGFSSMPYLKMVFPILLLMLLPVRHKIVPLLIDEKYMEALDGN